MSSFIISLCGLYGLCELWINFRFTNTYSRNYIYHAKLLYLILFFVGIGSMYFHSELTEFAHWIDIVIISMILVFSLYCLSDNYNSLKIKFQYLLLFMVHLCFSLYIPSIHIFIQFITGFLIQYRITKKISSLNMNTNTNNYLLVKTKFDNIKYLFYASLICWIIDYFGCDFIKSFHSDFHTHWIFHILIGVVSYKIIDTFKYLYV